MNRIINDHYTLFELYQSLRNQLMEILVDEELSYQPGGDNPTLGMLCREIGEIEYTYIQSFKTFRQDFSYRNNEPGLESSVEKLSNWFTALDHDLKTAIAALSEDDIENRLIDRGDDYPLSPFIQLVVYKEALLIFYGRISVYLKAMEKPLPKQWQEWIG